MTREVFVVSAARSAIGTYGGTFKDTPLADLATTIYHQLGITAEKELMAPGDRPIEIVDGGTVLKELIA